MDWVIRILIKSNIVIRIFEYFGVRLGGKEWIMLFKSGVEMLFMFYL